MEKVQSNVTFKVTSLLLTSYYPTLFCYVLIELNKYFASFNPILVNGTKFYTSQT